MQSQQNPGKRPPVQQAGSIYRLDYMGKVALVLSLFLLAHFGLAEPNPATGPEPAPTDAVKESGQHYTVEGRASVDQGPAFARYAALLDAYGELLKYGLSNGLFEGSWSENDSEFRFFRADADHPNPELLSWIARSKVVVEEQTKQNKLITLESPSRGSLAGAEPQLRAMVTQDVDGDGLSDVVGVGYDGSVYLLQRPARGESKVSARSPSLGMLELVAGPGLERVRVVLPQDIVSVEGTGDGFVRVLVDFEILEAANGELLGRAVEKREVLLPLDQSADRIRFSLSEPPDFAKMAVSDVEIRGTAISEKLLSNVEVRHNGTVAWESPDGIGIRALQFNLERSLMPGWNNFRIAARDDEGFMRIREIWLEGPRKPGRVTRGAGRRKRAVVVTLDTKLKESKLRKALEEAGFSEGSTTFLEGDRATAESVLAELRRDTGADDLLFYCEAVAQPGELIDGKNLLLGGGEVSASDLAQALEAGGYERTLGIFHTELPRDQRNSFSLHDLWRDTNVFLSRLGGAGRLMIANRENFDQGTRTQRKRSREGLLEALRVGAGEDLERVVDRKDLSRTLFRGWMFGEPLL